MEDVEPLLPGEGAAVAALLLLTVPLKLDAHLTCTIGKFSVSDPFHFDMIEKNADLFF